MPRRAFTLFELLAILVVLAVVAAAVVIPMLAAARRKAAMAQNANNLRTQHMGLAVVASGYGIHLPGLTDDPTNAHGNLAIPAGMTTTGSLTDDGTVAAARWWIVFSITSFRRELLLNPLDTAKAYAWGPMTTANFSHAMLRITGTSSDRERRAMWRDDNNALTVLLCDRNTGAGNADNQVSSLWTRRPGDWQGHVAWGDGHSTFERSQFVSMPHYCPGFPAGGIHAIFACAPGADRA
ncbi:MAG: hypothetical protein NTW19_19080 [Planctomycetota bacterium]|nr:hypothetical protein [Planctomycetota bacterium]